MNISDNLFSSISDFVYERQKDLAESLVGKQVKRGLETVTVLAFDAKKKTFTLKDTLGREYSQSAREFLSKPISE